MTDTDTGRGSISTPAPMLGDHLAMDLLNTQARNNDQLIDYWNSGRDVLEWLHRYGVVSTAAAKAIDLGQLLTRGMALRTLAHRLIIQRKNNEVGEFSELNEYLHAHLSTPHLDYSSNGKLVLARRPRGEAIASMLGPVAEAVAQLLVDGDFTLVKQCEHPDCILWFYDRTKAHKRRWCSMALCGNRHKAAQFRKRSSGASA